MQPQRGINKRKWKVPTFQSVLLLLT